MTKDALAGLTVLEFPDSVPIRYCGNLFSAYGARVLQAVTPGLSGIGYGGRVSLAFAEWLDHSETPLPKGETDAERQPGQHGRAGRGKDRVGEALLPRLYLVGANLTVPVLMVCIRKAYGLGKLAMIGGGMRLGVFTVA